MPAPDVAISKSQRQWKPPRTWARVWWGLAVVGYGLLLVVTFDVDVASTWARFLKGLEHGRAFLGGFLQPDFTSHRAQIIEGLQESLQMTVVATVVGVGLAIPVAFGASRTLVPGWVYAGCRALIAISRAFHEVIIAVLLVAVIGFGPLAGVITIAFATIGFYSKLLADEIESRQPVTLEAIRATGASWLQQATWAIWPQVQPRAVGLALYRLDINFRESAIVGIVGAGGIGTTLANAVKDHDWGTAAAVLVIIMALVLATEVLAGRIRRRLV